MTSPAGPPIPRPAATLAVVRDAERGIEVLLMHRTKAMDFAGGAHVFPGGAVDPADAALAHCCTGLDDPAASRRLEITDGGLAYWICAIRECFEEAGLLYAYAGEELVHFDSPVAREDAPSLRHALNAGERTFAATIEALGLRLATDRLAYLSHWITQAGRPRRYDTRFFIAAAPEHQRPKHDEGETVAHEWIMPRIALERHARGEMQLMFPTMKTLELLAGFGSVVDALDYAHTPRAMPPMSPRLASGRDGPKLLVPGDYAYAEVGRLDPEGKAPPLTRSAGRAGADRARIVRSPRRIRGDDRSARTRISGDAASGIAVIDPGPAIDALQAIVAAAAGDPLDPLHAHAHRPLARRGAARGADRRTGARHASEVSGAPGRNVRAHPRARARRAARGRRLPSACAAHTGTRLEPIVLPGRGRTSPLHRRSPDAGLDGRD
jgi:8-oxo-dGTP pyrophosphatase MutT (NUDIX family)